MRPRIILHSGGGGVGKTSIAAATARRCAAAGLETLIVSVDPAHSLAAALQSPVAAAPTRVGERLSAQQVEPRVQLRRDWPLVRAWLGEALTDHGLDRIAAEPLPIPPAGRELVGLLALGRLAAEDRWDVLVVDCAPTAETLAVLELAGVVRGRLDRLLGSDASLLAAARPFVRAFLDVTLPEEDVLGQARELAVELAGVDALLRDGRRATLRLVTTPEPTMIAAALRARTDLERQNCTVDAVVVNRVLPDEAGDYFAAWRGRQAAEIALAESAFAPLPVLRAPHLPEPVAGAAMLDRLGAAVPASLDAAALLLPSPAPVPPVRVGDIPTR